MASADYTRGEMDISEQERTWDGFMLASVWGSLIIAMVVGYATLAIPLGLHWMVALVLTAGAGLVAGVVMKMGGAWIATVIGMTGLAVVTQILITIGKWLIPG